MIGIILLVIPLGFLVVGTIYFSVILWKLKSPVQEHSPQEMIPIPPKVEISSLSRIGILEKEIATLNTKILSDEEVEFLFYALYIKSHDKVVEMNNIEIQLRKEKNGTQEWPSLKMIPMTINQVAMTKPIHDSKNKGELLWMQN